VAGMKIPGQDSMSGVIAWFRQSSCSVSVRHEDVRSEGRSPNNLLSNREFKWFNLVYGNHYESIHCGSHPFNIGNCLGQRLDQSSRE